MFEFLRKPAVTAVRVVRGWFARQPTSDPNGRLGRTAEVRVGQLLAQAPAVRAGATMDSCSADRIKAGHRMGRCEVDDRVLEYFLRDGFIGHHTAAMLATHWLIDKACHMPARDATRQGFDITTVDGSELDAAIAQRLKRADKAMRLNRHLLEFVHLGRVFGVRIAYFRVASTDPDYYVNPFNPDGVTPGSYKGVVQVDPYWCAPELDHAAVASPDSPHFYEPTYWQIGGRRFHRSHLIIFRNGQLPDLLKPAYQYGGVPVPQRILQRVFNAERTANEAPELAASKRTTVFFTDLAQALANRETFDANMRDWADYRDNYGVKVADKEADDIDQHDTTLSDLDAVIMGQYQLVAAAAGVPAVKLLGTTPKGFNATGEFEEASYHEELESIQTHDLTPLVERHHLLVLRSAGIANVETTVNWEALDSPTAKEYAEIELAHANRDKALMETGAIDAVDIRTRLREDRNGGYHGIEDVARDTPPEPGGFESAGVFDGVALLTNQQYLDPETVRAKIDVLDFTVQVTPVFTAEGGQAYRIILDGHHSLAAARQSGVAPTFVESAPTCGDYAPV